MFGTLVIILPSLHSGGDLVVQHADKERRISCSGSARDALLLPTWAAFYVSGVYKYVYVMIRIIMPSPSPHISHISHIPTPTHTQADCEHQLEEVTEGYRVALVYNLVRNPLHDICALPSQLAGNTHYYLYYTDYTISIAYTYHTHYYPYTDIIT
jgi:hypothetical protein